MQINSSPQPQSELIRDVPARILATLAEGQRVEATVIARLSADTVRLQLGNQLLQLQTRQDLKPGQQLVLERSVENGKPVLKLSVAAEVDKPVSAPLLRQGQQVAVEVVKLLAEQRLLVRPTLINSRQSDVATQQQIARLPAQIDIDISALKQTFLPGERLSLEVLREQPLAVRLQTSSQTRAELIQQYQRDVLPQLPRTSANLNNLLPLKSAAALSEPVRQAISQVVDGLAGRQGIQHAEGLKQAVSNSGLFLESHLKQAGKQATIQQDLKANLLQLGQTLKTALAQPNQARVLDSPDLMQKLPTEVQQALRQLLNPPQQMRSLPAQVPPALASQGQTPMQLLLSLLAGLSAAKVSAPPNTGPLGTASQPVVTGVQSYIQSQETISSPTQMAARAMEWQLLRDLLREVESATSRIHFNQLASLRDPDNPNNVNVWLFDLPVKDKQQLDMLQLRLEQHSPEFSSDEEAIWQVQLNLETQNLGPLQAKISLHQQDVKVVLLAEREDSASVLSRHIDDLNQRLVQVGVNVSHLSCRQGAVSPLTTDIEDAVSDHNLLDISV